MIFVGLGNPGSEYTGTRHNVGRDLLVRIQDEHAESFSPWKEKNSLQSVYATAHNRITFLLPQTYMNRSGEAVRRFADYFGTAPDTITVVHDDLDLPVGALKVSFGRGSGGHNGVEAISRALGTSAFVRVRVGISPRAEDGTAKRPEGEWVASRFVLGRFSPEERAEVFEGDALSRFESLVWELAQSRLEDVMTRFNARQQTGNKQEETE